MKYFLRRLTQLTIFNALKLFNKHKNLRVLTELEDFFFSPAQRREFYSFSRPVSFLQTPPDISSCGQSHERRIRV